MTFAFWRLSAICSLAANICSASYYDTFGDRSGYGTNFDQPFGRQLLTGVSYGSSSMLDKDADTTVTSQLQHQNHRIFSSGHSHYDDDLASLGGDQHAGLYDTGLGEKGFGGRRLRQSTAASAPVSLAVQQGALAPSAHGVIGKPDNATVYTIVNNNDAQFGVYVCIDSCAHGNTCIWQNAWLWMCNGTNPTHHYWVWEPDTLIIRSATTDSFMDYPKICLEMCTDTRYGNAACAMTAQLNTLNVGFAQCTGASNQQFTLNGTQIISKNNSQCLSAGPQPCGRWANCNKSQAQTRRDNYILNVFVEACDSNNANQRWSLGPAPNSTLINFTPLNESAIEYPPPVAGLAAIVQANSRQVNNYVDEKSGLCLSIENQASCQSSQSGSTINNPLSQVCVWNNALMQTCWSGGSDASGDQGWLYDNQTKLVALASSDQNVCLEMCTSTTFARGPCSLTDNNVIIQTCSGGPQQQFDFVDGTFYNEFTDMCLAVDPLCLIDYTVTTANLSAADTNVNGFRLGDCLTNVKNGPWSALPWNTTNGGPLGIQNLVGAPCDSNETISFFSQTAGSVTSTDPVVPGSISKATGQTSSGGGTSVGTIVGASVGAGVFLVALICGGFAFFTLRKRKAEQERMEEEWKIKMYNSGKLSSVDSDFYAPAKRRAWFENLDLGDEINPADIEICQHPDGGDWMLGEGAFGTVYRANRFGVQPVAVKALREESSKQIENFQREIELLRGLRDNNIVLFLGVCKKDGKLMLVTEFMPGGDLWHALNHQNSVKYTWYHRGRKIALDVARGLVHLHSRDIVHMDLKSPNILLGKDLTAKIADVGLARSITNNQITQMTSIGTMAWAAPELKRNFRIGRADGPRSVTAKADVFSFGVVLWEIVTAEDPTFCSRECKIPEECPEEIDRLMRDCCDDDIEARPTMKQVFDRLKRAAAIPPPGHSKPLVTPAPTPPLSRDGSVRTPPRSNLRCGPQSGPLSGYANRIGLAQALKKKLTSAHMSGGSPRSSFGSPKSSGGPRSSFGPPKSTLRADAIIEEEEEGRETAVDKIMQENAERDTHVKEDIPDDDSAKELTEKE